MKKFLALFTLTVLCLVVQAVKESTEHGSHGAEKHKPLHFKDGKHNTVYDYEALLGSRDHEELGELEPEQRRKALMTMAKSHDLNKNGIIEADELTDWVLHSFRMLDHQEAEERRKEEDDNEDGLIGFHEILKKQYGYSEEEVEALEQTGRSKRDVEEETGMDELVKEEKVRFEAADQNKDGVLNIDEYVAYSHPYDHPHMHEVEMARSMKEIDEDHDGIVSMKEFIGADESDEEARLAKVTNFEDLDKDKDGKLTPEEFKPWAVFDNSESAKEEAEHLLKQCDENEDGHLSIEEIVNKEEEFIESQATDYGRHLHFIRDEL